MIWFSIASNFSRLSSLTPVPWKYFLAHGNGKLSRSSACNFTKSEYRWCAAKFVPSLLVMTV